MATRIASVYHSGTRIEGPAAASFCEHADSGLAV